MRLTLKLLALALFLGFFLSIYLFGFFWYKSFDEKAESLSLASGPLPVSMTIFGRSSDTISARVNIYNSTGETLASLERSWPGWELILDCVLIGTKKGWIVFPYSVYSDETSPRGGSNLIRFYDNKGNPSLWEEMNLEKEQKLFLKQLFFIVKTERWMPSLLGSLHHEKVTIRSFESGMEYGLYISEEGSLFLKGY